MLVWIIVGVVVGLILIYTIALYNSLVRKRNNCEEAFSTMDVYLNQRWDLIPSLVETLKGASKHEKEALEKVIAARNVASYNNMSIDEKIELNNQLSQGIGRLFAVAENYPELKVNENFLQMQQQINVVENDIRNARKYYNGAVKILNNKIQVFPNFLFAKLFKVKPMKMFELENSEERERPKIDFTSEN